MKNIFLGIAFLLAIVAVPGCDNKAGDNQATEKNIAEEGAVTDPTQALAYICPMKCEGSGSNEPGKCKVCDMDLIKNPDHKGHTAATDSTTQQPE